VRILHAVLSGGFYGSERYLIELALAQARAGHSVTVLIRDRSSDCARQFLAAQAQAGALTGALRIAVLPRALPAFLQRPAAWLLLRRWRPDVVHSHLNPAARRIGAVAQRLGIVHVMTLHLDYDPNEHAGIDGLIALTAAQRARIPAGFGGAVAVVWNWLPASVEAALGRVGENQVARLRGDWDANNDTVVFGSVGRLTAAKGMDVLVRAFRAAFPDGAEPARLIIVGEGEARAELARLGGGDRRIVLAGRQDEVARCYRAFDVFVSAARYEPFGLAILEAMAAGCRLVVSRTEGPGEFLTDARVQWTAPGAVEPLAQRLRAAMAEGRARLAYDLAPFAGDRAARAIAAFYRTLLAAAAAPAGPAGSRGRPDEA
jgi:glycosyltransferase involved in cell wall biosynthesis